MKAEQRIAVLVDSENLEISVSKHFEPPEKLADSHVPYPDWITILKKIVAGRTLVRNVYYKKRSKTISSKFQRLWEAELGGEVKQPEKSVDPYIIVDAITLAEKVDVVVLLAGDKDYLPLIWYLKSRGCKVEIAAFADAASVVTRKQADRFFLLDEDDTIVLEKGSSTE